MFTSKSLLWELQCSTLDCAQSKTGTKVVKKWHARSGRKDGIDGVRLTTAATYLDLSDLTDFLCVVPLIATATLVFTL